MPVPTLLVPIDFSDCSWEATEHAARLATALGARVRLLHVLESPSKHSLDRVLPAHGGAAREVTLMRHLATAAAAGLMPYVEWLDGQGVLAFPLVQRGPVAESIVRVAEAIGSHLIVMSTHGRRGVARLLLGSVAEQVARHAPCPVMTVRTTHKPECAAKSCAWCDGTPSAPARKRVLWYSSVGALPLAAR